MPALVGCNHRNFGDAKERIPIMIGELEDRE